MFQRLAKRYRDERLRRFRIWQRFYMELRNEAYLRGTVRRRQQAQRAREIRQQNNQEFNQRMDRLVEGGKALNENRQQCVKKYKQTLKTKEDLRKNTKKKHEEWASFKKETHKLLLPLMNERKEKMDKIIQRRKEEITESSQEKKGNSSSINHTVEAPSLASIRAAFISFIKGVKRIDQTCKSYKGPKMYYMVYNIDYAITNVLCTVKGLLNGGTAMPLTQQHNHETLGKVEG